MKLTLICFLLFCIALLAQSAAAPIYAESFRQGGTRVTEDHFDLQLTPQNPSFRERIKDSHGADRYLLTLTPQGPEGDTEITSWVVQLADLQHKMYDNILLATRPSADEAGSDPKNSLSRLDPGKFSPIPLTAKRVIKVDGFYVSIQVKNFHFTPPDSPYLDSMSVFVEFTNSDPRAASVQNQKSFGNSKLNPKRGGFI